MGSIQSDGGAALLQTHQTFFLPDGEQLHFAILNKDGTINVAPDCPGGHCGQCSQRQYPAFRFDVDPSTGAMSVGGVAYGNTDAFRAAVQKNWDPGLTVQDGHGTFQDASNWTVAGKSGFYAPVLATQNGDIFVIGTANVDGHEHVRVFEHLRLRGTAC